MTQSTIKHRPHNARSAKRRPLSLIAALTSAPLVALLLLTGSPAHAGGHNHGFRDGFSNYHVGGRHLRNRHFRGNRYRGRDFRHRNNFRGYRYRRNRNNDGAYLIGGLVVGSLITHALHRNNDYRAERRYERLGAETYRRNSNSRTYAAGSQPSAPVSRHLFRDAQGNCFEKQQNDAGDELLTELPAEECRW